MGTRGFVGFVVDGEEKIAYNHFDSYPTGLGGDVLAALRVLNLADLRERAKHVQLVTDETPIPTGAELERLAPFVNSRVGGSFTNDGLSWYQLLRNTQGDIDAILEAGYIADAHMFPYDSLFAEWEYIIDLDGDGAFEVYRGFATAPHHKGRFAQRMSDEEYLAVNSHRVTRDYYPCWLVKSYPLGELPEVDFFTLEIEYLVNKAEGYEDE